MSMIQGGFKLYATAPKCGNLAEFVSQVQLCAFMSAMHVNITLRIVMSISLNVHEFLKILLHLDCV